MLYIIARKYFLTEFLLEPVQGMEDVSVIWIPRRPRDLLRSLIKPIDPYLVKWLGTSLVYDLNFVQALRNIGKTDDVLLFGVVNHKELKTICSLFHAREVSLYLWNPILTRNRSVKQRVRYVAALKQLADVCTFDPDDATRFGLKLVSQVYREVGILENENDGPDFDVFFLGKDKGRLSELLRFGQSLHQEGLTTHFHIVGDKDRKYGAQERQHLAPDGISYAENIAWVKRSRCLLEITQKNQAGPTLRSLEAAFMRKKLITDNFSISATDLYDPARVFLIGRDDPEWLRDFVRSPCPALPDSVLERYEIKHWCHQFACP